MHRQHRLSRRRRRPTHRSLRHHRRQMRRMHRAHRRQMRRMHRAHRRLTHPRRPTRRRPTHRSLCHRHRQMRRMHRPRRLPTHRRPRHPRSQPRHPSRRLHHRRPRPHRPRRSSLPNRSRRHPRLPRRFPRRYPRTRAQSYYSAAEALGPIVTRRWSVPCGSTPEPPRRTPRTAISPIKSFGTLRSWTPRLPACIAWLTPSSTPPVARLARFDTFASSRSSPPPTPRTSARSA